jgi:hypothetical protein
MGKFSEHRDRESQDSCDGGGRHRIQWFRIETFLIVVPFVVDERE